MNAAMSPGQAIRVGQLVGANRLSQGIAYLHDGQYTVEARIVNVVTGAIIVMESVSFPKDAAARPYMHQLAVSVMRTLDSVVRTNTEEHYVDLGLPSGTLWKDYNENGFFDHDAALKIFGDNLPNNEQFDELRTKCHWIWNGSGYKVIGPNGVSIVLPATGYRSCGGTVYDIGACGLYWSSDINNNSNYGWCLHFLSSFVHMNYDSNCGGVSVWLVKKAN